MAINYSGRVAVTHFRVLERYEDAYSLNRGTAPLKLSLNNGNAEVIVHFDEGKMVYELYASCTSEKELFIVSGADHAKSYHVDPKGYELRVKAFARKYL